MRLYGPKWPVGSPNLIFKFVRAQRAQTVWLVSLIVTVLLAVIASNFF